MLNILLKIKEYISRGKIVRFNFISPRIFHLLLQSLKIEDTTKINYRDHLVVDLDYIYIVRWSGNTVYYSRSVTRNTVNRAPHDSQRRNDSPRNESRGISRRQAEKKRQVSRCKQARHMDDRWKWITILAPARKHAFLAVSKNRTTDD